MGSLSLLHLPDKLLFFQSKFFPFKLEQFQLLLVLPGQICKLLLSFLESKCLDLVLIIDLHDLLDVLLAPRKVSHKVPVLDHQLDVLAFQVLDPRRLIFHFFFRFLQREAHAIELFALLEVKLLGKVFIEVVLLVEQKELLTHLLDLNCVSASSLLHRGEHLSHLGQLNLEEVVCPNQVIALSARLVQVSLDVVELFDLGVCLSKLVRALFCYRVVVNSQKGHLLEKNVVLFSQQMDSFLESLVVFTIWTLFTALCNHRQEINVVPRLLKQFEMLALLHLQVICQPVIVIDELFLPLELLLQVVPKRLNFFTLQFNLGFKLRDQRAQEMPTQKMLNLVKLESLFLLFRVSQDAIDLLSLELLLGSLEAHLVLSKLG